MCIRDRTSTKQEMLQAYNAILKELEARQQNELRPEKRAEEKKSREAVQIAESLTADGVAREIAALKLEIGKTLTGIADQLEGQVGRFVAIGNAIAAKEKEISELYEIEKAALSLAALIEAQNQKRAEFADEMEEKKEILREEIESTRAAWKKDQEERDAAVKDRDAAEKKRQAREKEEFDYTFKREKQETDDRFAYEKARLDKELTDKKERLEQELGAREAAVAAKEAELSDLRKQAATHPKELEAAVARAGTATADAPTAQATASDDTPYTAIACDPIVFTALLD